MRDTVNLIREGIPAVGLVHQPFEKLAELQLRALQAPGTPLLIYPQDLPSEDPPEAVLQKAREVAERVADLILALGKATKVYADA